VEITVPFAANAIDIVRATAIEEILPRYRSVAATKKDDGSLVTEADLAAQRALVRKLTALDNVPVLGEEMRGDEQARIWDADGRFWCVDPLDGTRNFMNGVPLFGVSVALMEGREPIFGVVYDPIADEAFYAVRGAGAWLNHKPLQVPIQGPALAAAVAEVSLRKEAAGLRNILKHRRPYAKRLTSGSSTLSWCHLAAARTDVFVHSGQMAWDYAAGALILSEAGGALATFEDEDFWKSDDLKRSVIAARTPRLFDEWRGWIRENLQ